MSLAKTKTWGRGAAPTPLTPIMLPACIQVTLSYFLSHDADRSREITIIFINYLSFRIYSFSFQNIHVTKRYNDRRGYQIIHTYINKMQRGGGGVYNLHQLSRKFKRASQLWPSFESPLKEEELCIEMKENDQILNQIYTVFGLLLYSMLVNGKKKKIC